eukprot:5295124-Pleurochrysis_carterae.AAC.2
MSIEYCTNYDKLRNLHENLQSKHQTLLEMMHRRLDFYEQLAVLRLRAAEMRSGCNSTPSELRHAGEGYRRLAPSTHGRATS